MPSKQEKQRRRAMVQQLRATEWEEACARKPIADADLVALIDHLEAGNSAFLLRSYDNKCQ